MYIHIVLLYILVAGLIAEVIYFNVIKKTPVRLSLFTESGKNGEFIPQSTDFTDIFEYDNRFEKIKGKVKFYVVFDGITKTYPVTLRLADSNNNSLTEQIVLSNDTSGVLEGNLPSVISLINIQIKTAAPPNTIRLLTIDLEYNF